MKLFLCCFSMTLRLGQSKKKTVWLFISLKLKHAKELTNKVFHLCTCCSCTEKCHLVENAYKKETNINEVRWTLSSCVSVTVIYCILFSSEENSFRFDRSHKFEENVFAIDCIWIDHVRLLSIRTPVIL